MSTAEITSKPVSAESKPVPEAKKADGKREKRTITEIRDLKKTGEKMVYMSVPDYTSAQWAEMAGVDVAVLGDSLAMIAHGHRSTIPATMDMMVMHGQAVRRGAPNTFLLGCMPYQSYNTVDRALVNATRFMQESLCDAVKPQGGKSQAHILRALVDAGIPTASHIGLTPHTIAMFGGLKIQGRTADAAMKIWKTRSQSRTPAALCWNSRQCQPRSPNSSPSSSQYRPSALVLGLAAMGKSCFATIFSAFLPTSSLNSPNGLLN